MFNRSAHPAQQICEVMKRVVDMGMGTMIGGNASLIDAGGSVWMTPHGADKTALTPEMVAKYLPDGTLDSKNRGSEEAKINIAIHRARPDIGGIVHGHAPSALAFMFMHREPELKILAGAAGNIKKAAYTPFRMPGSDELKDVVAAEFEKGADVVYLENHGVFVGGDDIYDAYAKLEAVELACKLQLNANAMPDSRTALLSNCQIEAYRAANVPPALGEYAPPVCSVSELELKKRLCTMARRAYLEHLITTYTGFLSMRTGESSFIFTPYHCDYLALDSEDIVSVSEGRVEKGKLLPAGAEAHLKVYEKHPSVSAVMSSAPAYGMAYAVTESEFNTYADFEIFFSVHGPAKLPFGADAEQVAGALDADTSVVLVENDYALTLARGHADPVIALSTAECLDFMARAEGLINVSGSHSVGASMPEAMDRWYDENIRGNA